MKNIKTFTGFLSLLIALSLVAFCSTAQAQFPIEEEESLYETEDTIPEKYIEQYPDDEPTLDADDLQPDIIDPAYEDPDSELLRDLEDDMELPPDNIPEDSESDNSTEDSPAFDLPSPEITDMASGAPSGLTTELSSPQTTPPQCAQAAGHAIILLDSKGIHSGVTYLQPGARVEFSNQSNVTHRVKISPPGFFTGNAFTITPHSKMLMFASSPTQVTGGSIIVNPGNSQTVHDVVICP